MPATGTPASSSRASPYTDEEATIRGSTDRGMPKADNNVSSHSNVEMFISCVRLALVTSVT